MTYAQELLELQARVIEECEYVADVELRNVTAESKGLTYPERNGLVLAIDLRAHGGFKDNRCIIVKYNWPGLGSQPGSIVNISMWCVKGETTRSFSSFDEVIFYINAVTIPREFCKQITNIDT